MKAAIIYMLAIVGAELVVYVFVQPVWGVVFHIVILVAVIMRSAIATKLSHRHRQLVLSLALVPLVRILSLSMPLVNIPQAWWYLVIYIPLIVAAIVAIRVMGYRLKDVGLSTRLSPIQLAVVPTSPNRALVGLLSRHSPEHYLSMLISSLSVQGKVVSGEVEFSYGGIPLRPLPRTYGDRLIVVGDAAGQVKPTTGGGIYYGLLCADIAADTLHRALETDALSAKGLANYEREWKKKIGRELKVGYWARKLYERLSDRQIDKMFDIIKNRGIDETLLKMEDLSFDWHSEAVLRLVGYRAVSTVLEVMKFPFRLTGR